MSYDFYTAVARSHNENSSLFCLTNITKMIELIILIGVGSSLFGAGAMKCFDNFIVNRKMKKNLDKMNAENIKLQESVTDMTTENKNLQNIRKNLEESSHSLKNELENLKDIMKISGEHGEEIYENLMKVFNDYKNIVEVDIKTKSVALLCDLDTNNDFSYSAAERVAAFAKLKLLFSEQHIDINDSDFDDMSKLKNKLINLFHTHINNN